MLTKGFVAKCGRAVGMTIRWKDDEFQVYPKGEGPDHPWAYFTGDAEDALRTAFAMVEGLELGEPRNFTDEEAKLIESSEWFNEDTHADHPIGDRLEAIGDSVYRVKFLHNGDKPDYAYFYKLEEALNA